MPTKPLPPSQVNRRALYVSKDTHRRLKMEAARQGTSMLSLIGKLLDKEQLCRDRMKRTHAADAQEDE